MDLSIPAVDVDPPSVDTGGFDFQQFGITVLEFIGGHPVPFVLLVIAALLMRWLGKPFMKGILIGCLVAAIVVYAVGG